MRFAIGVLITLFTPYYILAQNKPVNKGAEITFTKNKHDFGRVEEEVGSVNYRFAFENTGDAPLLISDVKTSCGCTTPDWSRDTISPGGKGFVDIKYETAHRPGVFHKIITVYSNSPTQPFVYLDINGDVAPAKIPERSVYMPENGRLYFSETTLDFKTVYDNGTDTLTTRLNNGTQYSTSILSIDGLPEYCKLIKYPKSLEPNESGLFTFQIDGTKIKGYGFGAFEFGITTDNPIQSQQLLYGAFNRRQYFGKLSSKQLKLAPKISFNKETHDFGDTIAGYVLQTDFVLTNTGKSELKLLEVRPECGCIMVDFPKNALQPGESMKIHLRFNTIGKDGTSNQGIWIVSNDPTRDEMHIYVRAKFPEHSQPCLGCHK